MGADGRGPGSRISRAIPAPLRPAARRLHRLLLRDIPAVAGHALMRGRNPHHILTRWPDGPIPLGPRVCVFAHWDPDGQVRPTVLHLLRGLAQAGLTIVFVTNAGWLQPTAWAALRGLCAAVLVRRNSGYDFGAWREGLEQAGLPRPGLQMLLLANDSIYGPLRPLAPLLQQIDFTQADLWGATDSPQIGYHVQSYLLAASPRVVASPAWRRFWAGVHPTGAKEWLIRAYEVGLTRRMRRAGFRVRALFPYETLIAGAPPPAGTDSGAAQAAWVQAAVQEGRHLNPTHHLWRQLLRAGFPFLKRELLRDNPGRVPDLADWRAEAARCGQDGLAEIAADLAPPP